MRLNELKGYKDIANNVATGWSPRYIGGEGVSAKYLEKQGLEHLGSGSYGETWDFGNPNWVLKVFEQDNGYKTWVDFCLKNRNNPYCPKFKIKLIPLKFGLTGAIIERLTKADVSAYKKFDFERDVLTLFLKIQANNITNVKEYFIQRPLSLMDVKMSIPAGSGINTRNNEEVADYVIGQYQIFKNNHHLIEILRFISQFDNDSIADNGFGYDLSVGNVMLRNNQIVITDPLG